MKIFMPIEYVIINFLILAALIFVFGRKMIASIFKTRRQRVRRELEEIEEAAKTELICAEPETLPEEDDEASPEIERAEKALEDKLSQISDYENRERHLLHYRMVQSARDGMYAQMKKQVAQLFSKEPLKSRAEGRNAYLVDRILGMIKLTSGDKTYMKHHGVLYVTLTSACPLPKELTELVDKATERLAQSVNGKTSLWVLVDPNLISGLKLRIGDTVYDATVAEELYQFEKRMHRDLVDDDSPESLLEEFFHRAKDFEPGINVYQLGRAMTVSDGICWMDGLADIMYGEVVEFECGERGMVLDIQKNRIGCVIFGSFEHIESGSRVRRVGRIASVPVGEAMLGRVVDALGSPVDGEGFLVTKERRPIEFNAPGILDRAPVDTPLHTGIKVIDALIPIGKGQRELIIGDRQTGKSSIAVDTIINQKGKDTVCVYVAIGQKDTQIAELKERLRSHGALDYTVIVSAPASGSAALQYIAPFSGTAMAEYFMYRGQDVLIVYDDLSKHAVAYRELSLLLHRPSGREAYPGDIFYLHSRLLERAAHLSKENGGGSMTALPIIETLGGDISAYIPTNVISITDGQIFLETDLFNAGQRPAVNASLSVSRVGGAAQTKLKKQVAASLRTKLAQYRELEEFTQFGTDVDEETRKILDSGRTLTEILKQSRGSPVAEHLQSLLLFAVNEGYADGLSPDELGEFEAGLYAWFESCPAELAKKLKSGQKLDNDTRQQLKEALNAYVQRA